MIIKKIFTQMKNKVVGNLNILQKVETSNKRFERKKSNLKF